MATSASLGEEIYRTRDKRGWILVYQKGDLRTLSFGHNDEQSGMSLSQPQRLEYRYTQAMMLGPLLVEQVHRVTVLGLGGGSLVRALLFAFPECRVTVVENRPQVVTVAKKYFSLPDHPQLKIQIADAGRFIAEAHQPCDLMFTDLYHGEGMDDQQTHKIFLARCRAALGGTGLLVMNLWNTDYRYSRRNKAALADAFGDHLFIVTLACGNNIAFAFAEPPPRFERKAFFESAHELGLHMDIPLQRLARHLWLQNSSAIQTRDRS